MPDSLITWLIESVTSESVAKSPVTKRPPKCYSQPNAEVKYVVHDHELDNILSLLPDKYLNTYSDWLYVLTAFKRLNAVRTYSQSE